MNKENKEKLLSAFSFYKTQRPYSFNFECGDGWFDIIWEMSLKIKNANPSPDTAILIKEKFGTLRISIFGQENQEIIKIINEAEVLSAKTCEVCGLPGSENEGLRWIRTLCSKHYFKQLIKEKI